MRSPRGSLLSLLLLAPLASSAAPPFFSVDAASPSFPGVSNSDALAPGPVGGPPMLALSLGLAPGDEVNALTDTAPSTGLTLHFSVDRASLGAPGTAPDVASEASAGQQAGDVYSTALAGANQLAFNQSILGELPPIAPGATASPPIDDLDGLELSSTLPVIFSLVTGHPYFGLSLMVGCGGDLFAPGPSLVSAFADLGLASCADDVDALHLDDVTLEAYFSLAPGSPSLLPGSPITGCAAGCSPADVFLVSGFSPGVPGSAVLFASASALGLLPGDNVNALSFGPGPPQVPALGALAPALALLLAIAARLQWRRPRGTG